MSSGVRSCRLEELPGLAGSELGTSAWIPISQDRIDAFANATEDRQWIHVDPVAAAAGPYGATIAHGYLTLSLVSPIIQELLAVEDAVAALNYGLDRVRFPAPVLVGSHVRGSGLLLRVDEVPSGLQTTTQITLTSDTATKPVCVADVLTRFLTN